MKSLTWRSDEHDERARELGFVDCFDSGRERLRVDDQALDRVALRDNLELVRKLAVRYEVGSRTSAGAPVQLTRHSRHSL